MLTIAHVRLASFCEHVDSSVQLPMRSDFVKYSFSSVVAVVGVTWVTMLSVCRSGMLQ